MKKHLSYAVLLLCAALTACSKEETGSAAAGEKGVLAMSISATRADAGGDYDPLAHLAVRIYQSREGTDVLLRQYTEQTLPSRLELLAGDYRVAVEAGERVPASFSKRYYTGENTFKVTAGETTPAEVECARQNVVAEVKFDATVATAFSSDFRAWVVTADGYDAQQVQDGDVPALEYLTDGTGYFTLPEGVTTLTAYFEGTHPERGAVTNETKFTNVQTGGKYTVTFKYSKDLPGSVECFILKVDTSTDDQDDTIIFTPEASVTGDGFDITATQDFVPGKTAAKGYRIAAQASIRTATVSIGSDTYDLLNGTTEGIEVVRENVSNMTFSLSDAFFAGRPGGRNTVSIRVADSGGGDLTVVSEYRLQGILPVAESDCDLWQNSVTLRALVLDPDITTVNFGLRSAGGEWIDAAGVSDGDGNFSANFKPEWTADVNNAGLTYHTPKAGTGVFAANDYESRAVIGATEHTAPFTTAGGQSIPDGNMENGSLSCFGTSNESTTTWGSGNNSVKKGLCTQSTMNGSKCAQLSASETLGMLAAGNLFFGTFKFTSPFGPGTVGFGQKYEYTARPSALKVKYHATVGTVDVNKHNGPLAPGEQDISQIFVCIVDWSEQRKVTSGTGTPTGTWSPEAQADLEGSGAIIAYGILPIAKSTEGTSLIPAEIPLRFYDKDAAKPQGRYTLVISCSTSTYGDYMNGCSKNVMYVDDFEWVY